MILYVQGNLFRSPAQTLVNTVNTVGVRRDAKFCVSTMNVMPQHNIRTEDRPADKYQGKYRIPSARWAVWDYSANAAYFVTICIEGRAHLFGEVVNEEMMLTPLGQAAYDCWQAIPDHFPFVVLDVWVVMPNHVHGIIIIDKPDGGGGQGPNRFGPQSQNLASIIRGYKIGVTKFARAHNLPFEWQARYHDHVIRDVAEYERIRAYIIENPKRWNEDCYRM